MELGCDPRGYSRAGHHTVTWYCAVIAGRHSPELSTMRGVSAFSCHFGPQHCAQSAFRE